MSLNKEVTDPSVCPICGRPNNCSRVRDPNASNCWCRKANFPPAIFDLIPESQKGKACICRDCFERFLREKNI